MARKPYIPASPHELSPAWVTRVLHEQGSLQPEQRVVGLDVGPVGGGISLAGEVVRVGLRYDGVDAVDHPDVPQTVVAKFPNPNPTDRAMIESQGVYEREILFYRDIAPRLPFAIPKLFGAAMDPGPPHAVVSRMASGIERLPTKAHAQLAKNPSRFLRPTKRRYALLLEDLGDNHHIYGLATPPPVERLKVILAKLAQLHAHFWGDDELARHRACWPIVTETPLLQRNIYQLVADEATERYELSEPSVQALCNEASDRFPSDVARLNRPITFIHSDTRSDNFLFSDAGGETGDVAIVDWAMVAFADPGYDVGYLLSSSLDSALGRPIARELAQFYLAELALHGVSYPAEELWSSIEAAARVAVVQQTLSLSLFNAENLDHGHPTDHWLPRALALLI